jgi:hypothetical protein
MQKGVSVYAVEGLLEVIAALLSCVEFEGSGGSNRVLADILERSHQLGFLILCLLACVRSLLKAKFCLTLSKCILNYTLTQIAILMIVKSNHRSSAGSQKTREKRKDLK